MVQRKETRLQVFMTSTNQFERHWILEQQMKRFQSKEKELWKHGDSYMTNMILESNFYKVMALNCASVFHLVILPYINSITSNYGVIMEQYKICEPLFLWLMACNKCSSDVAGLKAFTNVPKCLCGVVLCLLNTSNTKNNPRHQFLCCPNRKRVVNTIINFVRNKYNN